jgi:ABC-type phosphonate transport system ATPase subunit
MTLNQAGDPSALYKAAAGRQWCPLAGPVVPQPQSTLQPQQYARGGRGKRGLAIGNHHYGKLRTTAGAARLMASNRERHSSRSGRCRG